MFATWFFYVFCNIRIFPYEFATFCFATFGILPKNHATIFCNKNVAKKLSLQHFSNVAKKRPMLQKKKPMGGGAGGQFWGFFFKINILKKKYLKI